MSAAGGSACARSSRQLDITGVDLAERPDYPGPFVQADAAEGLPFADGEFELVYCSSVIEHVPPARRAAFAREIRRVGRGWFVQTPACRSRSSPTRCCRARTGCRRGCAGPTGGSVRAGEWEDISLLRRGELEALFGPALAERVGPLTKSWVCVRAGGRLERRAQPPRRPMSLLTPLITRNSSSTMPTEL